MMILLVVLGVVCLAAFIALFVWVRRSERDVDYDALLGESTQSDKGRRAMQVGIGLNSGPSTYGL